jgi:hypothetical protein
MAGLEGRRARFQANPISPPPAPVFGVAMGFLPVNWQLGAMNEIGGPKSGRRESWAIAPTLLSAREDIKNTLVAWNR